MIDDPTAPDYRPPPLRSEMVFQYGSGDGPGYGDEVVLIGCALASDKVLPSLRWLDRKEFLADPRLGNVAQAILDQADAGLPHNAEAVTEVLRARRQLPPEWDPRLALRDVDPRGYALGAWESTAMPPEYGDRCAREIRHQYARHAVRAIATATLDTLDRAGEVDSASWEGTTASPSSLAGQMVDWARQIPPPLTIPSSSSEPSLEGSNLGLPERPKLTLGARLAIQESAQASTRARR